jgi:tripartite ATP-independent transporter DctP family solute receptor
MWVRRALPMGVCLTLFLGGCGGPSEEFVIKLGHGLDRQHSVHAAMEFMGKRLAEMSEGSLRIEVYPSEQLGTERQCLELLQIGSLGMTKVSAAVMEGFVPSYRVFGIPYLFRDEEHQFRVLEGSIGREILLSSEPYWLRGLCFFDAGSRSFYTKDRPIRAPSDLRGLKIRVQESPNFMRMVNLLGGSATPISWGELYTALQQGVVDGAENNPPSFYFSNHYEVCRYYTLTEHTATPDVLLMSTWVWNRLNDHQKRLVEAAAREAAEHQRELWKRSTEEAMRAVREAGVEIIVPDKTPFMEELEPLVESYRSQEEIYRRIREIRALQ